MEPRKQIVALRIGAVLAVVGIALASYSGVVATPPQEVHAAQAPASELRPSSEPSFGYPSISPDAKPDDVETFY